MAITFHCEHCGQFMSIATKMAGVRVPCPTCAHEVVVPTPEVAPTDEESNDAPPAAPQWWRTKSPVGAPATADQTPDEPGAVPVLDVSESEELPLWEQPATDEAPGAGDSQLGGVAYAEPRGRRTSRRRRRSAENEEEMDLTSMVDVTFLLLVFFMITASFTRQKSFEIPPPDPEKKGAAQRPLFLVDLERVSIRVTIDAQNRVSVDDEPVADTGNLAGLFSVLGSERSELLLTTDESALHETVVLVLDAAQDAGLQRIRMTTTSDGDDG